MDDHRPALELFQVVRLCRAGETAEEIKERLNIAGKGSLGPPRWPNTSEGELAELQSRAQCVSDRRDWLMGKECIAIC